jgi:hypothetical protein
MSDQGTSLFQRVCRAALALALAAAFLAPAMAGKLGGPPCPDTDGDGFVVCTGSCDPTGKTCGECNDASAATFPGAAPLDSAVACMKDSDNDNYGDSNPPGGVTAGTDCNDASASTFPGAASEESPSACMKDSDGDDWGDPSPPAGVTGGSDCNDADAGVNPGATEVCGDGKDNDCYMGADTILKEVCTFTNPDGCDPENPGTEGCCAKVGVEVCEGASAVCELCDVDSGGFIDLDSCQVPDAGDLPSHDPETYLDPLCYDGVDNDCNGLTDQDDPDCNGPEVCNGSDDDGDDQIDEDFPTLGTGCSAGVGSCTDLGAYQCSSDGTGVVCDAVAKDPGTENTPGKGKCVDGKDNDCDGLTDLDDPDCQLDHELCDGKDNTGDGQIDEDFSDLGSACSAGVGNCEQQGVMVCKGDQTGTRCSAFPGNAGVEGPTGATCEDGQDNDCDGAIDLEDSACGSVGLTVGCSLDDEQPEPDCDDEDCDETYKVHIVTNAGENATVHAELVGLDSEGNIVEPSSIDDENWDWDDELPEGPAVLSIKDGEEAHLASHTNPKHWNWFSEPDFDDEVPDKQKHLMFAPVPMVRVSVDDGAIKRTAYCSSVPYLEVVQPSNTVITDSGDGSIPVEVAIPGIDPASLTVKIDGVEILTGMGLDPALDLPGGPFDGNVLIGTSLVHIEDLVVSSGKIDELAANSLTMLVSGLGCGGHIVVVRGEFRPCEDDEQSDELIADDTDGLEEVGADSGGFDNLAFADHAGAPKSANGSADPTIDSQGSAQAPKLFPDRAAFRRGPARGELSRGGAGPLKGANQTSDIETAGQGFNQNQDLFNGSAGETEQEAKKKGKKEPPDCYIDDREDKGTAMVFSVKIIIPGSGDVVPGPEIQVAAEVCDGQPIIAADINGGRVSDVTGQILIPGDGEDSADTYKLSINEFRGVTDLQHDFTAGDAPLGTFDPGSNRLVVTATDEQGKRAFDSLIFGVGDVLRPTPASLDGQQILAKGAETVNLMLKQLAKKYIKDKINQQLATAEIADAYVIGISEDAVQKVIDEGCATALTQFKAGVNEALPPGTEVGDPFTVGGGCSCDPTVHTKIQSISIGNNVSCVVDMVTDKINVVISLPDINFTLKAYGSCKTTGTACIPFTDACVSVCLAETIVNTTFPSAITGIEAQFAITEGQLLQTESPGGVTMGECENDSSFRCNIPSECAAHGGGKCVVGQVSGSPNITAEVNCLASACNWVADAFIAFVNIFGADLEPMIVSFSVDTEFAEDIGAAEPDPIGIGTIGVNSLEFAQAGQKQESTLTSVSIEPDGLIAGMKGSFQTLLVDPTIPDHPGAELTPAPLPTFSQTPNANVFLGLSDDAFNMMFASLVDSGKMKQGCEDTGKVVEDLLPADCLSIEVATICQGGTNTGLACTTNADCPPAGTCKGSDVASLIAAGICQGIKAQGAANPHDPTGPASDVCEALGLGTPATTNLLAQGTCHGVRGATCSGITGGVIEKLACNVAPPIPLSGASPLLFCVEQAIPPNLKLRDGGGAGVQATLRLGDMSVALLVDRGTPGHVGDFHGTASCFNDSTPASEDCGMFGLCLDLNLETSMQFQTCTDGEPGLVTSVDQAVVTIRPGGSVCAGGVAQDDGLITEAGVQDASVVDLTDTIQAATPPFCADGLTLVGDAFPITNPTLFVLETDGNADFQDYLCIGDVD